MKNRKGSILHFVGRMRTRVGPFCMSLWDQLAVEQHRNAQKPGHMSRTWIEQLRDDTKLLFCHERFFWYSSQAKSMCVIQQMRMSMKRTRVWNSFALMLTKSNFIKTYLFNTFSYIYRSLVYMLGQVYAFIEYRK